MNNYPAFFKGVNYIPPDMFMPRVTHQVYKDIFDTMIEGNYNSIRIWGGGNYENETFFDYCDENGIMVW